MVSYLATQPDGVQCAKRYERSLEVAIEKRNWHLLLYVVQW